MAHRNEALADLRLQRGAEHLHALGPRPLAEFLADVGRTLRAERIIVAKLDDWRSLTPEIVRRVGGDRSPVRRPLAVPQ